MWELRVEELKEETSGDYGKSFFDPACPKDDKTPESKEGRVCWVLISSKHTELCSFFIIIVIRPVINIYTYYSEFTV